MDKDTDPRVSLAEDRTALAAERTFAAWLRTGLAFLGAGLVAQRFLREVLPDWELRVLSLTLIVCALASFAAAGWRDHRVRLRLGTPEIGLLPRAVALGASVLLFAVSMLAAIALWLSRG
ncbi:MAG: DUF202 domain-containing protein [Acetobacteraceae bacterium]